jgi:uncharacterized protein (TIGR02996 family)
MSTERAALINAILRSPDDDGPRLVCADWFEEQGGEADVARAEFIRLQVLRARMPAEDPRQREMYARELRLLRRYAAAWQGTHFAFRKSRFRRGFIEYVHLHLDHFQHHRRQLFALEPVRDVSLTGFWRARPESIGRVAGCAEWRHVDTLRIHCQGPHQWPPAAVLTLLESPHLTGLRRLRCDAAEFDAADRRRFERILQREALTDAQLPLLDFRAADQEWWFEGAGAHGVRALRALHFSYTTVPSRHLERVAAEPFWAGLSDLELAICDAEGARVLGERLPPGLKRLNLRVEQHSGDFRTDGLYERLAGTPLEVLRVRGGWMCGPAAFGRLLDENSRCRLRELTLRCHGTSLEHVVALAASPGSRHLRTLELYLADVPSDRIASTLALGSSDQLERLVSLGIAGNSDGTGALKALASAAGWESLRTLLLDFGGFDRDGLQAFSASPIAHRLNSLTLWSGGMGLQPDLAEALAALPHLAAVSVSGVMPLSVAQILSASESIARAEILHRGVQTTRSGQILAEPPVDDFWRSTEEGF